MSYIAVGLKVIEGLSQSVARGTGVSEDRVLAGLVRLWHRVWTTKSDVLTLAHLAGVFGADQIEAIAEALCADFLEPVEGGFRVRGASRYLRLKSARSEAAKKTNEKRWSGRSRATMSDEENRSRATGSDRSTSLLPPSTEHRAPSTTTEKTSPASQAPLALVETKPTEQPKRPTPKPSDELVADFEAVVGSKYAWNGAVDGSAFAWLLKQAPLEEVRARWRRGLSQPPGWKQVRTVAQLRSKWNDLADDVGRKPSEPSKWKGTGPITVTEVTL